MTISELLKSKTYPISVDRKEIINDPYPSERRLAREYTGTSYFGISGKHLKMYQVYQGYKIISKEEAR